MKKTVYKDLLVWQTLALIWSNYTIVGFFSCILSWLYFFKGIKHPFIIISSIFVIVILCNTLIFKLHKKLYFAYLLTICVSFIYVFAFVYFTGGIVSPALFIFIVFPLPAFTTSKKQGKFWSVMVLLAIIIMYIAGNFQILTPENIIPEKNQNLFSFAIMLFVTPMCLCISFLANRSSYKAQQSKQKLHNLNEELQQTTAKLKKLSIVASKTKNAVIIADSKGNLEWVNEGFRRLTGYSLEEYVKEKGRSLAEVSGSTEIKEAINTCIKTKKATVYEAMNVTKDGREIWVQSTLSPIIENGALKNLVIIDSDITERKKAEEEIIQKNKDITDSILYAKRIQEAILPTNKLIKKLLVDYFIFYKPKDIVSGDFYWVTAINQPTTKNSNEISKVIIAACDCTGHGVPGAFMSMIGHNILNQIVVENKITQPDKILNELNKAIKKRLHQTETSEVQDGMDIALCSIDVVNGHAHSLQFAGAYNPLYLIRDNELNIYDSPHCNIGGKLNAKFIYHEIKIKEGDVFYIFSDGYQDQQGGERGKKFMRKHFRELLVSIHHLPMKKQEDVLNQTFEEWKGEYDQVDDVLVIGVKF